LIGVRFYIPVVNIDFGARVCHEERRAHSDPTPDGSVVYILERSSTLITERESLIAVQQHRFMISSIARIPLVM
jgi:hypothetical protein